MDSLVAGQYKAWDKAGQVLSESSESSLFSLVTSFASARLKKILVAVDFVGNG
jgi:hypothetical protein